MRLNKFLFLALFALAFSFPSLKAQDTLWTRNMYPYNLVNAVFSPDGNYIYASSDGSPKLFKYDLQGNLIWTNDTVGGLKQFSSEGNYFYNLKGDKYNTNTFQKLGGINVNWGGIKGIVINESKNIGIAFPYTALADTSINNLIFFRPSNFSNISLTNHPEKTYECIDASISPNGQLVALSFVKSIQDYKGNWSYNYRVEVWSLDSLKPIKILYETPYSPPYDIEIKVKFSPDGKLLGISTGMQVVLYRLEDYKGVAAYNCLSEFINRFDFSKDSKYLFISMGYSGLKKINLENNEAESINLFCLDSKIFGINGNSSRIISSKVNSWMALLDNSTNRVIDLFFTQNCQVGLTPNPANSYLEVNINSDNYNYLEYSISNLLGQIVYQTSYQDLNSGTNQFTIDLESLNSGTYFFNCSIGSHAQSFRFNVEK